MLIGDLFTSSYMRIDVKWQILDEYINEQSRLLKL